jgi:serine/threonine protein kinase/class 3 adenylate cyclase
MDLYRNNIDQLLQARSEIDEELRRHKTLVTIFFTDVVGSTTYFDRFGDTAGLLLLHRHDSLVTSAVEEFHGMVIKKIGDSVMADFPEPALAVRAAIAIQRRLFDQNQSVGESERLRIRTGIHYGPGFRRGNDLFGDAINMAARITKHSGPSQILISHAVREVLSDAEFNCSSIGGVSLEGKADMEELHQVIWTDATSPMPSGFLPISLSDFSVEEQGGAPDLPRYEILARVGVGTTGLLFKARDRETGEIVALKVLKAEIADQPLLIDAFKNELRLARKITHKNVCRIYDFNRVSGLSFISMEFVEGESLRRVLNRFNALSTRTGIKIASQICEGLREAHAQGIVHRDLKPENLMIDGSGNVKLMDFGLAHLVAEGTTDAVGTPSYMAPEQAQGAPIDQRCDIYALGLVLFEMFTGTSAFTGETPMVVALKHIQDAPRNPRDIEHTIPEHIAKSILRCLEKDPDKRFQSVDELQAAISDESHSPESKSRMRKDTPWAARAAAGLATFVAVFLTAAFIQIGRGSAPKSAPDSPPSAAEFSAFHMAESINTEEAWNTFLKNYSKGGLVSVARARVERLKAARESESTETPIMLKTDLAAAVPKPADATPLKLSGFVDLVQMPGGIFMMGKDNGKRDERPQHQVRVEAFRISRSEVTNRQYLAFLDDTGYPRPKDPAFARPYLTAYPDLPAVNVSYDDALAFCKWASGKFGIALRLPTEAEWEYAAQKPFAHSTAWEWVADYYSKDYYVTSPVKNPAGPTTGTKRVVRGENQSRAGRDPKDHGDQIGFRIVVSAQNLH